MGSHPRRGPNAPVPASLLQSRRNWRPSRSMSGLMDHRRLFVALASGALALASGSPAPVSAQPAPARSAAPRVAYQSVAADQTPPLEDARGVPRTPRLSVAPSVSYVSLAIDREAVDLFGFGGQIDLHVPLGVYVLVGARGRYERRAVIDPTSTDALFGSERAAGDLLDLAALAQLRLIAHTMEVGLGVAVGPSRLGFDGQYDWGYAVDPHISIRAGSIVAFAMNLGLLIRRWPASGALEVGIHGTLGLSFLLGNHR